MFYLAAANEPAALVTAMNKVISGFRLLAGYLQMVRDPARLDVVFRMMDGVRESDADGAISGFLSRPEVRAVTGDTRPPLYLRLEELRALPEGSLGRAYAEFIDAHGFDLEALYRFKDRRREATLEPEERLTIHMERSHDLWHVVTGFETDIAGELGLQAFYVAQLGTPIAAAVISALLLNAVVRAPLDVPERMEAISTGWRHGQACESLFGADWAALVHEPLEDVRARFGITPAAVAGAAACVSCEAQRSAA